jgi:tetratricopeptide (TPR) repeat protein
MRVKTKYIFLIVLCATLFSCKAHKSIVVTKAEKTVVNEEDYTRFMTFFYEGIKQKEDRKFDQALETFRICESIDSTDGGLQSELGQLYTAMGRKNEALLASKKAYESNVKNWWYNVNLISLYAALQKPNEAIEIATNLEKHFPEKEDVYQILSSLYRQTKQPAKSIEALNKLESIAGIDGSLSMEKFNLYLELKQNKKAIAEIDKLSAKFPSDMRFKVLRGDIYMYQKMPEKAFEIYKQVEANEPDNPYVFVSLSEYYKEKGDTENSKLNIVKALKLDALEVEQKITILGDYVKDLVRDTVKLDETESLFKLLLDRYPLEEKVYDYYAVFLQFRKRYPEALATYETMLNIDQKNVQTWMQIIQIRLQEQNFTELQKTTDRAIAILPDIHQYYFYKGIAETQLKNYKTALLVNNKALSLVKEEEKPIKSDYYAQIGDIYYKMDSTERAFEAYEKALEANPANIYVMNNYAYYLSEKNQNLKKAESLSAKTIEKEPKNSTYLDTYAWIFYQQGNYSLAKFYMERAIDNADKKQDTAVMYEHYGDILLKTGNEKKALEMWKKAYESENKTDALKLKIDKLTETLKKNEK